jgi:hypothetical protein
MSPRSGAGEAKQRPVRLSINRSPQPSIETGQLHSAPPPQPPSAASIFCAASCCTLVMTWLYTSNVMPIVECRRRWL